MHAGKQVAQRVLQRQRDRKAPDAQRGQERGDRDPQGPQQDQDPGRDYEHLDHALGQPGRLDRDLGLLNRVDREPRCQIGRHKRNRQDY